MQPPRDSRGVFDTPDLILACFLHCRGFTFLDLRREESRMVFVFEDSTRLRQAIVDYANDAPVGVRSFSNTLRDLKALVRESGYRTAEHGL